jgi:predicted CopG family antitoxin
VTVCSYPQHEGGRGAKFPAGRRLKPIVQLLHEVATADPPTTITIRTSTRHLLEAMKRPGESYDELIQELTEEYYPPRVMAELRRRVDAIRSSRVKGVPAEEMRRRLGL